MIENASSKVGNSWGFFSVLNTAKYLTYLTLIENEGDVKLSVIVHNPFCQKTGIKSPSINGYKNFIVWYVFLVFKNYIFIIFFNVISTVTSVFFF